MEVFSLVAAFKIQVVDTLQLATEAAAPAIQANATVSSCSRSKPSRTTSFYNLFGPFVNFYRYETEKYGLLRDRNAGGAELRPELHHRLDLEKFSTFFRNFRSDG